MSDQLTKFKRLSYLRELALFMGKMLPGGRWKLPAALVLSCAEVAILVLTPLLAARIINALATFRWEDFRHNLIQLGLLTVAQLIISFGRQYVFLRIDESVGNRLRQNLVDTVLHKRIQFFERHWVGDIVSRAVNDSSLLKPFLTGILLQMVVDGISLVVVIAVLVWMNPVLASLTIATAPITLLYGRKMQSKLETASQRIREDVAAMTGHLQSWLSHTFPIKIYSLENKASRRFAARSDQLAANTIRFGVLGAGFGALNTTLLGIPSLLIFGYGGYIVLRGRLTIGQLFAFMTYASYFSGPVQRLISINVVTLPALYPVYRRVREFISPDDMDEILPHRETGPIAEIQVNDLSFNFDERPGFRLNVPEFVARHGEIVGIAGNNGSGKSTLARLLAGFYQPQRGSVRLLKKNGEQENTHRQYFSFLPQNSPLFDGSLLENATLFDSNLNLTRLERIEGELFLDAWIRSLPDGWQTRINAGLASTFSGGQIQKIGLARLLYTPRPLFLLDEPTNGLDEASFQSLKEILVGLSVDRPIIVIAHSVNALALCDRIYGLRPEKNGEFVCLEEACH